MADATEDVASPMKPIGTLPLPMNRVYLPDGSYSECAGFMQIENGHLLFFRDEEGVLLLDAFAPGEWSRCKAIS